MEHDMTLYVGLDVHKDSITVAYAIGGGEVELLGKIGTTLADVDRLCKRLQSKARGVSVVYEAERCGYGLYRQLVQKDFEYMVCAPSLCAFWVVKTAHTTLTVRVRLVAVLYAVVQSGRSFDEHVLHVCKVRDLGFCRWIAAQLIGDDLARHRARTQYTLEEAFSSGLLTPLLHQNIEFGAVLVDRTPQ
jgi:hypothetical protein